MRKRLLACCIDHLIAVVIHALYMAMAREYYEYGHHTGPVIRTVITVLLTGRFWYQIGCPSLVRARRRRREVEAGILGVIFWLIAPGPGPFRAVSSLSTHFVDTSHKRKKRKITKKKQKKASGPDLCKPAESKIKLYQANRARAENLLVPIHDDHALLGTCMKEKRLSPRLVIYHGDPISEIPGSEISNSHLHFDRGWRMMPASVRQAPLGCYPPREGKCN